jgi:asparagine synthase (glutamine-hydrolysing)
MCGISGLVNFIDKKQANFLRCLSEFISARGPDDCGSWLGEFRSVNITLLHSRLSIIDTTMAAHQPMVDEYSEWAIVFNGEIYNYQSIQDELKQLGWSFNSKSDTEVLLKAWSQWGLDALPRLNGMFAFAVVHRHTGEMWLVRDRFGVKPLLWARTNDGGVVFSSSVAAVAKSISAEVNTDYCAFGLRYKAFEMPEGQTAFDGVQSVQSGGWLRMRIRDGGITIHEGCWYDLEHAVACKRDAIANMRDEQLLQQCQFLLKDALRLRLRSDVPLAVSLSGGLDSTTIAALAVGNVSDLHGFTYGAAAANQSEGPVVARFANQAGITPHFIWPELGATGLDSLLERTLTWQEAPFPGLSVMAQNEVFRAVRDAGFKVLLGGQGGDEIFAGYRKFFVVAARYALGSHDISGAVRLLYSLGLMLMHEVGAAGTYWRALSRYDNKRYKGFSLLDWTPMSANLWGESCTSLTDRQIKDMQRWSIPTLLRYEDRNSMGHGVESRLPFMDYRLVELALALPVRLKIANGFGKWAIRHVTRGVVPDFIRLNRKKRGFDVTQTWIADGLGKAIRARLHEQNNALAPFMKKNLNIDQVLSDHALQTNSDLLDEALMLVWLAKPIRQPAIKMLVSA